MDYKLYQSELIKNNHQMFIDDCEYTYNYLKKIYNGDPTWNYKKYNFFSVTAQSFLFYDLYKELNYHIRSFIGNSKPLWIQSWLNYHISSTTLSKSLGKEKGFHYHDSEYHGYISIDPQNTVTKFKNGLEIKNQTGQIYLGPGARSEINKTDEWDHFVEEITPSSQPRITIGFNINCTINTQGSPNTFPLL